MVGIQESGFLGSGAIKSEKEHILDRAAKKSGHKDFFDFLKKIKE